jgi:hypothetical protein
LDERRVHARIVGQRSDERGVDARLCECALSRTWESSPISGETDLLESIAERQNALLTAGGVDELIDEVGGQLRLDGGRVGEAGGRGLVNPRV